MVEGFLKRHPDISHRYAEEINNARATVIEANTRNWFEELEGFLTETNCADILKDPSRIFNADESSFQTCPKTGKVLGPISFDNFYEIKSGNEKEAITVMANFSADGKTVCPMVVYRSACSQMTTLGALFDQPTKDPFLNKDKDIIKNTLPDGWRNWALNECAPPPFSQAHRNKLRFALPSLEVVRAFTKEDHISERSYKKMLSSLLDWPVGQALILAPSNLSSAYRPSKESYEQFLADTSSLKSLILSRKEINAALENSQDHGRKSLSPETDISSLRIKPIRGNRSCPSIDRAY